MTGLTALIAAIEAATGPDRALDERIAMACGWILGEIGLWKSPAGAWHSSPPGFTGSLDAARGTIDGNLLRLGLDWQTGNRWKATLKVGGPVRETVGLGANKPLATLAASMRLKEREG